ncbi:hypothetical protein OAV41_00165 [Planctomycetota bacterium]|nr:hypothetical protein [Planctomycetota bacterium]
MIVELSSLCLSLLQVQQLEPTIDIERGEVNLSADAISSEAIDGGVRYTLDNFTLTSNVSLLSAQQATIEVLNTSEKGTPNVGWGAALLRGLGFDSDSSSLRLAEISGNLVLKEPRFDITADKLSLRPLESISEFLNVRATFSNDTIGPNGWPILIVADKLLELPGGILEFYQCDFSTCLTYPQHYSTSFELLRATKLDSGQMSWHPEGAWFNLYGYPIIPLPSPDFVDGEDIFGLKGFSIGTSRITGTTITPKFGGRTTFDALRSIEWSVSPGYSDLRGLPLSFDTTYVEDRFFSSLSGFYLDDDLAKDFNPLGGTIARDNSQRYLIDWHNHWQLSKQWNLYADLALTSDSLVYPEFFRREWLTHDDAESAIELFNRAEDYYFSATITLPGLGSGYTPLEGFGSPPGPQGQYLSYQPYSEFLSYATAGEGWRPPWLNTSWGMGGGYMTLRDYSIDSATTTDYLANLDASRARVSSWANASASFNLDGFNLAPSLTMRASSWRDDAPVALSDRQLYLESSVSSSAIFVQRYDDGWTHKAIPSISLRGQHALVAPNNIPDNFDGNDSLQEGRLAELSLRQFFYAPNSVSPWLDMQFLQPYYLTASTSLGSSLMPFSTTNISSGLGPTEMRMKWTPSVHGNVFKGMTALANIRYDFELNRADEVVAQISMRPRSNYFYGFNYLETNGTPQDFALGSAYAGLRVSEEWSATIRKSRNFSGDAGFYSKWEVTHHGHDFNFQLGYTLVESTGVDGIYFSVSPRFASEKFNSFDYDPRDLY